MIEIQGSNMFSTQADYMESGLDKIYSLKAGAPSTLVRQQCAELIQKATLSLHKLDQCPDAFMYGADPGPSVFRQQVAKFLTEQYGDPVDHEDLWVNAGASQGLAFIGSFLFQPGDVVFAEEPAYYIGLRALRDDLAMKVIGIPSDNDGIIVEELEKLIMEHSEKLRPPTEKSHTLPCCIVCPHSTTQLVLFFRQRDARRLLSCSENTTSLLFVMMSTIYYHTQMTSHLLRGSLRLMTSLMLITKEMSFPMVLFQNSSPLGCVLGGWSFLNE